MEYLLEYGADIYIYIFVCIYIYMEYVAVHSKLMTYLLQDGYRSWEPAEAAFLQPLAFGRSHHDVGVASHRGLSLKWVAIRELNLS